jgi:hypothetical protein
VGFYYFTGSDYTYGTSSSGRTGMNCKENKIILVTFT